MDKEEIISYIKQNKGVEIAELQKKFGLTYRLAKEIIDGMVSDGELIFAEGVRYNYTGNNEDTQTGMQSDSERHRAEAIKKIRNGVRGEQKNSSKRMSFRDFFQLSEKQPEQPDEDADDEDDDFEEAPDKELRLNALKLCIQRGIASVSMLQRSFPIGYIKACSLIDWMEESGYISSSKDSSPRQVLITEEEYNNLVWQNEDEDDDDDDEEEDERFIRYEQSLWKNLSEDTDGDEINQPESTDLSAQKSGIQSLVNVLKRIEEIKKSPVSSEIIPQHSLWSNGEEFANTVMERMKRLILSDKKMGKLGAVKRAEAYLEAARDTCDRKMVQVYERLVYEIKNTSNYLYLQLKRQFFGNL